VRFLIDAQLPPALAKALRDAGHAAEHVEDVGLRHAKDTAIWDYARQHGTVLITKDEDFVERYRRLEGSPALLWLRLGNASRQKLLAWFMPLLPQLVQRLESGDKFVEVR
jgi:predicted nuclease of predicted toxin-antitoxin system